MNALDVAKLEGEFMDRALAEKAAGDLLAASTWQLAAAMLVNAQSAASDAVAPLMGPEALAAALGIEGSYPEQTVCRWYREGRIPAAIKEGNILRFDLAAVRSALAARAETQAAAVAA